MAPKAGATRVLPVGGWGEILAAAQGAEKPDEHGSPGGSAVYGGEGGAAEGPTKRMKVAWCGGQPLGPRGSGNLGSAAQRQSHPFRAALPRGAVVDVPLSDSRQVGRDGAGGAAALDLMGDVPQQCGLRSGQGAESVATAEPLELTNAGGVRRRPEPAG